MKTCNIILDNTNESLYEKIVTVSTKGNHRMKSLWKIIKIYIFIKLASFTIPFAVGVYIMWDFFAELIRLNMGM